MSSAIYNIPNFSRFSIYSYSRFNLSVSESDITVFTREYRERIKKQLIREEEQLKTPFISFAEISTLGDEEWLRDNYERFFHYTPNVEIAKVYFLSEMGYICCTLYSPDGTCVIVGHATGLIQINITNSETTAMCIRADPGLESLNMQFYGSPGISSCSTPFITQRSPALSLGITEDGSKMVIGYGDTSIKVHDMETQEAISTFKVHKLRLQFIPKKLQRMHFGQVCAVRCHNQRPNVFASAAWDKTLRIWDTRCKIGCVMTFEGVDVCSDSIDLNRDHCISGSWQPTEALCVWDMVARKRLNVIRVQNRRPDVDGEYIYTCRYWSSSQYNRKGKYCIIGGSGTKCVEVINLHNRYIACSYPAAGSVLAVTSYEERIAFGGTAPVFNIVTFHDPKHEEYEGPPDPVMDYNKSFTLYNDDTESVYSSYEAAEQLKVTPTESKFVSKSNSSTN